MTIVHVIIGCLNNVALALTPQERWAALTKYHHNPMTDRWFIVTGTVAIVILSILFFVITIKRVKYEKKNSSDLFDKYSQERGLSEDEDQLLSDIARKANLKRNESVFTMFTAFDSGVSAMKKSFSGNHQTPEYYQMKLTLASLRQKLGFTKQASFSRGKPKKSVRLSSRDVRVGKKIIITRRSGQTADGIEAVVVGNTEDDFIVELTEQIKITFGEFWCVRYFQGSSIWEFDSSVLSYDGRRLILRHNDNVRFINRRRFVRVPVIMPAFIARFPFESSCMETNSDGIDNHGNDNDRQQSQAFIWGPPEFVPAVVTELAGPGLRIESTLDVKVGDRVLVVFNLGQDKGSSSSTRAGKPESYSVVEDIGLVRNVKSVQNGLSIAVELTGLNDSNINKLICAANTTSRQQSDSNENSTVPELASSHVRS
jgi:hypothetical protein